MSWEIGCQFRELSDSSGFVCCAVLLKAKHALAYACQSYLNKTAFNMNVRDLNNLYKGHLIHEQPLHTSFLIVQPSPLGQSFQYLLYFLSQGI